MIKTLNKLKNDLLHLVFPHYCEGCGADVANEHQLLCLKCLNELPETNFLPVIDNPIEKIFYGRLSLEAAGSGYYFTKESMLQHLVVEMKYRGNKSIGVYFGKLMGHLLKESVRFEPIDAIVPIPLNARKLEKRGYNQAALICEGISEVWGKPVITGAVERKINTDTQTHKSRVSRWQSMQDAFNVKEPAALQGKHILLVDDIITTGATLEACGGVMLKVPGLRLSVTTVAYTI